MAGSPHHKGMVAELLAIAWLARRGYQVFRNVSRHGPADVIAIKDGKVTLIDVKAMSRPPGVNNCWVVATPSQEQVALGVVHLHAHEDGQCFWADEVRGMNADIRAARAPRTGPAQRGECRTDGCVALEKVRGLCGRCYEREVLYPGISAHLARTISATRTLRGKPLEGLFRGGSGRGGEGSGDC
jgi:Holliday junction resolvase-like predicted endonuclease